MDELQKQILIIALTSFLIGFMMWIILLKSFLISWLKVRLLKGDRVLVKVVSILGDYYTVGRYNKQHIEFTAKKRIDNNKPNRIIWVNPEVEGYAFYNSFGVRCIDVDDAKDLIYFRHDEGYKKIPPINTEYYDELVKTALLKPSEEGVGFFSAKVWQAIILISILLLGFIAIMIYKDVKQVNERLLLLHDEHINIAYELNQTKTLIDKNIINENTGINLLGG